MYNVQSQFAALVREECGVVSSPEMYAAFLLHFNVVSEYTIYACLITDTARVRTWIRQYAEENLS